MLSIAIYSDYNVDTEQLKSIIQDFLIEMKMMAKVSYFNDPEALILAPSSFRLDVMPTTLTITILSKLSVTVIFVG